MVDKDTAGSATDEKDVKTASSTENGASDVKKDSSTDTHDEHGVPWKNRAMEAERWKREAYEAKEKAAEYESRLDQQRGQESDGIDKETLTQEELKNFVIDPSGYIDRKIQERELKRELPQAINWLKSQEGFAKEDETKIMQIIQEHDLVNIPSPMARAKTAWKMLQSDKLKSKMESTMEERSREDKTKKSSSEGIGRSASVKDGPRRADLLKALHKAEKSGDFRKSAEIVSALEDTRE